VQMVNDMIELKGKTVALLGLAFKPETDDMREAPSIAIASSLKSKGAIVKGYDPIAKETAEIAIPDIIHCQSLQMAVEDADVIILVTEWDEFKNLQPKQLEKMSGNIIIDGRRVLNKELFSNAGFKIKILGQN